TSLGELGNSKRLAQMSVEPFASAMDKVYLVTYPIRIRRQLSDVSQIDLLGYFGDEECARGARGFRMDLAFHCIATSELMEPTRLHEYLRHLEAARDLRCVDLLGMFLGGRRHRRGPDEERKELGGSTARANAVVHRRGYDGALRR